MDYDYICIWCTGGYNIAYLGLLQAWEIRTRARMYSLNVECSIRIQNQMFLTNDHGKNAVQSYGNFSRALIQQ